MQIPAEGDDFKFIELWPGAVRTFLGVVTTSIRDGRSTVKSVMEATGRRSTRDTHDYLRDLRDAGLVTWEPNHKGTLRPLYGPVRFG